MPGTCVLALDLGTTAFKAAPASTSGLCGPVSVVPYAVEYGPDGTVVCGADLYKRLAFRALRAAARTAQELGYSVTAIGISSQAQTFVPVDARNRPTSHAVVWTDTSAVQEADSAAASLPDFAETCGFLRPSPLQFLPKVARYLRNCGRCHRFLLLNEWIAYCLTGHAFGDACLQGMGGFWDIRRGTWNERALAWAGIGSQCLAPVQGAGIPAGLGLTQAAAKTLGLAHGIPVYSCGNDQSCAAIGAGALHPGDVFANMGTAMVVYVVKDEPPVPTRLDQIAGVSPLPNKWYLLGVVSECGNVVEWLVRLLDRRGDIGLALERALEKRIRTGLSASVRLHGGGILDLRHLQVGMEAPEILRAVLDYYSRRFGQLLNGICPQRPRRLIAGGGLSRSPSWLRHLTQQHGVEMIPAPMEHPGLMGIARVVSLLGEETT